MPVWLIVLIGIAFLLALGGVILLPNHRPPSGPKGPQLPPEEFDATTFVRPRPAPDNTRSHHSTNRKK